MKTSEYLVIVALRLILRYLLNPDPIRNTDDYNEWLVHAGVYLMSKEEREQ